VVWSLQISNLETDDIAAVEAFMERYRGQFVG
jgi:hypothetical protein